MVEEVGGIEESADEWKMTVFFMWFAEYTVVSEQKLEGGKGAILSSVDGLNRAVHGVTEEEKGPAAVYLCLWETGEREKPSAACKVIRHFLRSPSLSHGF